MKSTVLGIRREITAVIVFLYFIGAVRAEAGWLEMQKLLASDGVAYDYFGHSTSISGDYAIMGAPYNDDKGTDSGSAYIFKWNGVSWVQQQNLLASDGAAGDYFGNSVSISGDYAIAGAHYDYDNGLASGSAYIFRRDGESWIQQTKLIVPDGLFGRSVSISGDYAIVGTYYGTGSAYIFGRDGENWVQQQKLTASDGAAGDYFGNSVSISGDYAIVGAYRDDDEERDSGSVYIFRQYGVNWVELQKITASDGAFDDRFGVSVAINGDYAIAGAYYDDDKGTNSGSAYIFELIGGPLTLLVPNGGEKLIAGSSCDIIWDTNGVVENVFIEYWADNGANWIAIDTVPNSGSYLWTVAGVDSNQCLVRVGVAGLPSASDVSDDVFRIYICTLSYDLNHDCFLNFEDFSLLASEWLRCGDPADPDCQP